MSCVPEFCAPLTFSYVFFYKFEPLTSISVTLLVLEQQYTVYETIKTGVAVLHMSLRNSLYSHRFNFFFYFAYGYIKTNFDDAKLYTDL